MHFTNPYAPHDREGASTKLPRVSVNGEFSNIRIVTTRNNGYSETNNFSLRNSFSITSLHLPYDIGDLLDDGKQNKIQAMDRGYNQGIGISNTCTSVNSVISKASKFNIQKHSYLRGILLMFSVPFSVLSINQMEASAKWYDRFNPISEETVSKYESMVNQVYKIFEWFKNIKENIIELSTDLLIWIFETLTKVVLHTPSFLFDSVWFKSNIVTFTGLSIAMVIVLSMYEGFKRMSGQLIKNKTVTDIKRIIKRFPLVIIGSALAPSMFYYVFKGLNKLTDIIIDFGKHQMDKGMSELNINDISLLQVVGFVGFDIALISILIPILLQNFRRWFDLLALGALTPLALACWVFNSCEHLFDIWWNHIKKCASVQIVYAIFLLLIGTLLFGTKLPNNGWDIMIQMGIVIGGLWRMNTPPSIMSRYSDKGSDIKSMWNGAFRVIRPIKLKPNLFKKNSKGVSAN